MNDIIMINHPSPDKILDERFKGIIFINEMEHSELNFTDTILYIEAEDNIKFSRSLSDLEIKSFPDSL